MSSLLNICRFNPTAGGTTDWTYSSAVTGYQSPTAANAVNGATYSYRAESSDLSQWEVGFGAYNSGTGVFGRTTVLFNSLGTTAKINFSTVPQVAVVALAEDLATPAIIRNFVDGLALSAAGGTATFGVAAGVAASSTNIDFLTLSSAISKSSSSNWTVGNNGGALDTGSTTANTWYHVFLIKRPDTRVVDVLVSLSATSPALPTNYTLFRRIGSMKTDGSSQWIAFRQFGDEFMWVTPVKDIDSGGFPASDTPVAVNSVPSGLTAVKGFFNVTAFTGTAVQLQLYVRSGFMTSQAPAFGNAPGVTFYDNTPSGQGVTGNLELWCDAGPLMVFRPNVAATTIRVVTRGWLDRRGRDN